MCVCVYVYIYISVIFDYCSKTMSLEYSQHMKKFI